MKRITLVLFLAAITGCATEGLKVGNTAYADSMTDMRAVNTTITVYEETPEEAYDIEVLKAQRCHRKFTEKAPSEGILELDLKMDAYSLGLDGINITKISKKSGLARNCWSVITAEAEAFKMPK